MNSILDKYRNHIKYLFFINIFAICSFYFLSNDFISKNESGFIILFTNKIFISFLDYILLYFNQLIIKILFIYFVPLATAFLLFKIFNKYLSVFWSSILSFVGIFSNETLPFRSYLMSANNEIVKINFEIFSFPFPSLTFLFFLFIFYITINTFKYTHRIVFTYTLLWILLAELSFVTGFIGIIFWVSYFPLKIFTSNFKKNNIYSFTIYIIFIFFYLFLKFYNINFNNFPQSDNFQIQYLLYHLLIYLILPSFLTILAIVYIKVDIYEFIIKFSSIFILMIADHLILIFFILSGQDAVKIDSNIQMIFAHFYFFVPCIYFLDRSIISFRGFSEKKNFIFYIKNSLYYFFNYLLVFIAIIFYIIYNIYILEYI